MPSLIFFLADFPFYRIAAAIHSASLLCRARNISYRCIFIDRFPYQALMCEASLPPRLDDL